MSWGPVFAVCVLSTAACLKEPKFNGTEQPPGDGDTDAPDGMVDPLACPSSATDISVSRTGTSMRGANVCGPGYQMVFSDVSARMPYQLIVNGQQLLGVGENCNDERGMGLGLYPAGLINGEPQSPAVVDGVLTTPMTGPVIGRVAIDWSANYTCTGSATLQDSSTFTFFPDGHITRFDRYTQTSSVGGMGCGVCSGGGSSNTMYLTSYLTLVAPANSTLSNANAPVLDTYDESVGNLRSTCLHNPNNQNVAIGWRDTATRIRVVDEQPRTFAFVQDIANGTTLGPLMGEVTTHMIVSGTRQCADLDTDALRFANRPELHVQALDVGPSLDGIYGGENDSGGVAIQTQVGPIALSLTSAAAPIPAGWAVWISFGSQQNGNVQVTHNGVPSAPAGEWFRTQRVSNSQIIFWFRDALVDAQTVITITPG